MLFKRFLSELSFTVTSYVTLLRYWKKIKQYVNEGNFLCTGTYCVLWAKKPVLCSVDRKSEFAVLKEIYPPFIMKLFRRQFKVINPITIFPGEWALITLNSDAKFFSESQCEVLTVQPVSKRKMTEHNVQKLQNLQLTYKYSTEYGVVDKYIKDVSRFILKKRGERYLFSKMMNVLCNYLNKDIIVCEKKIVEKSRIRNKRLKRIEEKIVDNIENVLMPVVFCHGDYHFGNFLVDNNDSFAIDIEYARTEIFIYDVFSAIIVSFWDDKSSVLLEDCLRKNSVVLQHVKACFEKVNFVFDDNKVKNYIYAFLYRRLLFDEENAHKRFSLWRYSRYIKYLEMKYTEVIEFIESYHA